MDIPKRNSGFPRTGFYNAEFNIIGPGNDQSRYRCRSSDNKSKINLSGTASKALGKNCNVNYISKTKKEFISGGTPVVIMEYNKNLSGNENWVEIDRYTIPTPERWATGVGVVTYGNKTSLSNSTIFPALDACSNVTAGTTKWQQAAGQNQSDRIFRQKYMYRRDELSNSPYANRTTYPEGSHPSYVNNFYSRDVDGTFMGDWGNVQAYSNSVWKQASYYWTAEADPINNFVYLPIYELL